MDERIRFVIRLKDGESMASLCREFGISRKTRYKIVTGRRNVVWRGSRIVRAAPAGMRINCPSRWQPQSWLPARAAELGRAPLEDALGRHATFAGLNPNALLCTDYKGEFLLGNKRYCHPLTVTDHASRYLLLCEAMESDQEQFAFTASERLFKERGLPEAIRSDNGVPFASPNGLFNLSKLSVWWLRLGISIERIRPGHPQQNGRHERMHLTLKKEATRPAGANLLQQQAKFDAFIEEFNNERPHEALGMKCPADVYTASTRPYNCIPEPRYPFHDETVLVTNCGRLCLYRIRAERLNVVRELLLKGHHHGKASGIPEDSLLDVIHADREERRGTR